MSLREIVIRKRTDGFVAWCAGCEAVLSLYHQERASCREAAKAGPCFCDDSPPVKDDEQTIAEWDWMVLASWRVLHHAAEWNPNSDDVAAGNGVTSCGRKGWLAVPGVFTRMGAARCKQCCRNLGYPEGVGSPKNDALCRPLVEARLREAVE